MLLWSPNSTYLTLSRWFCSNSIKPKYELLSSADFSSARTWESTESLAESSCIPKHFLPTDSKLCTRSWVMGCSDVLSSMETHDKYTQKWKWRHRGTHSLWRAFFSWHVHTSTGLASPFPSKDVTISGCQVSQTEVGIAADYTRSGIPGDYYFNINTCGYISSELGITGEWW